jgi:cbb3-type cytochrome oxidase maturation protein
MNVILYLLGASLLLGGGALAIFLWSLRTGQYDDMEGAANRILFEDDEASPRYFRPPATRQNTDVGH